ncbi:hypothetical protein D9615_003769 [Tricholomella constricta]|uniref:Smr domain-containing protein n=1 Tax=Tricholomella constricta TaxID=117010 RepID=A0A8H5HHV2_9AGAR|nr:hypothetical protein D9615_003769 [Tricholomella constricta]
MSSNTTLFDSLQREFCPPLDSSLLAALLADLESDAQGNVIVPTPRQIDDLRITLWELSSQADESQLSEFSDLQLTSTTDDTSSTPDFYNGNTATSSSLNSDSSDSSHLSFSSPLGFLQAALPHISTKTLSSALENADADDMDMWDIVAGILTAESIREMEERGLDGMDDEGLDRTIREDDITWETIEHNKKPSMKMKARKQRTARGKTMTLVDVRQQQHAQYVPKRSNSDAARPVAAPDPWTQLASLSSHLATLLPPHPPAFFQSYFHCPNYATPYVALHACLKSICSSQPERFLEEHTDTLFTLLDILLPIYEDLDSEQRSRLISDVEVSLQATHDRGDDALDLAKLLRDLDSDSTSYLEMGVYHVSPQVEARPRQTLPSGPPPIQPPPQLRPKPKPPPSSKKPSPFQWQFVPQRRTSNGGPHPLAPFIPAYTRDVNGNKVKGAGNAYGQGGKGDVGELCEHRRKVGESMRKRNELLKQATRMWQKGNSKTRGGEVAFYFAERAREFQELARTEALSAARTMVESKRLASNDPYTVDLHGTTASEAIIIVKEVLQALNTSPGKPVKIITGRGSHSVNQPLPRAAKAKAAAVGKPPAKTKSKPASVKVKSKPPGASFVRRLVLLLLSLFTAYALIMCRTDSSRTSSVCKSLDAYRTHILDPYVVPPLQSLLHHTELHLAPLKPYATSTITFTRTHITPPASVAFSYIITQYNAHIAARFHWFFIDQYWNGIIKPIYFKGIHPFLETQSRPYRIYYHRLLVPLARKAVAQIEVWYIQTRPHVVTYIELARNQACDTYEAAKPHALAAYARVRPHLVLVLDQARAHALLVACKAGEARRQYIDPPVRRIWEKVGEAEVVSSASSVPPESVGPVPTSTPTTTEASVDEAAIPTPTGTATPDHAASAFSDIVASALAHSSMLASSSASASASASITASDAELNSAP